jgi:hypothetical protein
MRPLLRTYAAARLVHLSAVDGVIVVSTWFFHWDFVAGQWRTHSGRGHLPTRKSTSEPRRGIVLFARQCVVGSSVVDLRGLLLCPVRAKADIESGSRWRKRGMICLSSRRS